MKLDQLLLGQIPEAIYFALFMILVKNIKEKRILFMVLMILEYILLKLAFPFNMWFQVTYTFMTYIILKLLYKEKSQITDIFTFGIGSIILMIISIVVCLLFRNNIIVIAILSRSLMFGFLFIFRHRLNKIQNLYKSLLDYRYDRVETYPDETVGDFAERCQIGTYLITMPNHITTVIDGVVYDTFDCRDRGLWDVWKVL